MTVTICARHEEHDGPDHDRSINFGRAGLVEWATSELKFVKLQFADVSNRRLPVNELSECLRHEAFRYLNAGHLGHTNYNDYYGDDDGKDFFPHDVDDLVETWKWGLRTFLDSILYFKDPISQRYDYFTVDDKGNWTDEYPVPTPYDIDLSTTELIITLSVLAKIRNETVGDYYINAFTYFLSDIDKDSHMGKSICLYYNW
jgi:hypothetical protein